MPNPRFEQLQTILRDRGVPACYATRLIEELDDHYCDLESEHLAADDSLRNPASVTRRLLGSDLAIAEQVLARPELRGRCFGVRASLRAARVPAEVLSFGPDEGAAIARWSASIGLGTLVTAAILLALARTLVMGI